MIAIPSVVATGVVAATVATAVTVGMITIAPVIAGAVAVTISTVVVSALDQLAEACDLLACQSGFDAIPEGGDTLGFGPPKRAMKCEDGATILVNGFNHMAPSLFTGDRPLRCGITNASHRCAEGSVMTFACGTGTVTGRFDACTISFVAVSDCGNLALGKVERCKCATENGCCIVASVIGAAVVATDRYITITPAGTDVCATIADRSVHNLIRFRSVEPELTDVELYFGGSVTGHNVELLEREAAGAVSLDREVLTPDSQSGDGKCSQKGCEKFTVHGQLLLGVMPGNPGEKGIITFALMLCCVWDTRSHGRLRIS